MKKEIPQPLLYGAIALAVLVVGLIFWRLAAGPGEIAPAPEMPKVIPQYIFDTLPPAEQQRYLNEGYTVTTDTGPTGIPGQKP